MSQPIQTSHKKQQSNNHTNNSYNNNNKETLLNNKPNDKSSTNTSVNKPASDNFIYSSDRFSGYDVSIPSTEEGKEQEEREVEARLMQRSKITTSISDHFEDARKAIPQIDQLEERQKLKKPAERKNDYLKRAYSRAMTPNRIDAFATPGPDGQTPSKQSYADIMKRREFEREKQHTLKKIQKKIDEQNLKTAQKQKIAEKSDQSSKKRRWDAKNEETTTEPLKTAKRAWDEEDMTLSHKNTQLNPWDKTPSASISLQNLKSNAISTPKARHAWSDTPKTQTFAQTPASASVRHHYPWEKTPAGSKTPGLGSQTPGRWNATPGGGHATPRRWEATPTASATPHDSSYATPGATPAVTPSAISAAATPLSTHAAKISATPLLKRSRWDETPDMRAKTKAATPAPYTPGVTPKGALGMNLMTPMPSGMTPEQIRSWSVQNDTDMRNLPISDAELNQLLPKSGYEIVDRPTDYNPIVHHTPSLQTGAAATPRLLTTPTPFGMTPQYMIPNTGESPSVSHNAFGIPILKDEDEELPMLKPTDMEFFSKLINESDSDAKTTDQQKERKIMKLLLKVKNGTPPQRKTALRQLSEKALFFGAGPLFNRILPMLMSASLEDQERHLLVKVIDRILYKLDDKVRPYVHKILVVIEPLLIDEDYYARVEGREIISNLAKAAGLATMISTMRPDIDNVDEYVRNTTARAFSVVASAIGIPSLLPFLKAVCQSKKSWQARHTGIKIIQQIAILMGCAILPHLKSLVEIVQHGLIDEQSKVRTICALALAALAEAAHPYGIESFDSVLRPLWKGIRQHRGKTLAAFLKAIGYIIPLMDSGYANYYTREVMQILIREFSSPDEEMKKIVLKVVKQCVATEGVHATYIQDEILPEFFRQFWIRRMALDRRNYRQLVDTTVELAVKVGGSEIIGRIVEDLKDESEPYRKMVLETIENVLENLGPSAAAADIDLRLEEQLVDGVLFCFQEQQAEDASVMLRGFASVAHTLGPMRLKAYVPQILGLIKWRLNNKTAFVRQHSADLINYIAQDLKSSGDEKSLGHLGIVLYEYLGEEYPDVLGSILGALKSIVNVIGMTEMTPPIKDLLPRLTPILKNRNEKVQENCIDLVGRIADRGAEFVSPKEWMRICFELLEMLKAHKKTIRRATVNTFGYIAKAIGPSDVLATLLNNLRVQERQNRVCTTVAIAIVAETCSPFTVLPALMNEYRVPELNVQNGVLKSLSFLFEYIGELAKDYIYSVTPLLEDALMDRDLVHRQTACSTVKHLALGVAGLGCEDAMHHLLNFVWPNVFETSPHVINAVTEAMDGLRLALGPSICMLYFLQGLFHPARKVRSVYWRLYNNLYIGAQDAMVACYPKVPNTDENHYHREELDFFI